MTIVVEEFAGNPWHDEAGLFAPKGQGRKSGGTTAKGEGKGNWRSTREKKRIQAQAQDKVRNAPQPTEADVIHGVVDAMLARDKLQRPGGERRGNPKDRRRRGTALAEEFGDGRTCPCVDCGETMAATKEIGEELGIDTLTQDKVVVGIEGGSYKVENLVPACKPCNQERGDRDVGVASSVEPDWGDPAAYAAEVVARSGPAIQAEYERRRTAILERRAAKTGTTSATIEWLDGRWIDGVAADHVLGVRDPEGVDGIRRQDAFDDDGVEGLVGLAATGVLPARPLGAYEVAIRRHVAEATRRIIDDLGLVASGELADPLSELEDEYLDGLSSLVASMFEQMASLARQRLNERALVASPVAIQLANPWHDEQGLFAPKGQGRKGGGGVDASGVGVREAASRVDELLRQAEAGGDAKAIAGEIRRQAYGEPPGKLRDDILRVQNWLETGDVAKAREMHDRYIGVEAAKPVPAASAATHVQREVVTSGTSHEVTTADGKLITLDDPDGRFTPEEIAATLNGAADAWEMAPLTQRPRTLSKGEKLLVQTGRKLGDAIAADDIDEVDRLGAQFSDDLEHLPAGSIGRKLGENAMEALNNYDMIAFEANLRQLKIEEFGRPPRIVVKGVDALAAHYEASGYSTTKAAMKAATVIAHVVRAEVDVITMNGDKPTEYLTTPSTGEGTHFMPAASTVERARYVAAHEYGHVRMNTGDDSMDTIERTFMIDARMTAADPETGMPRAETAAMNSMSDYGKSKDVEAHAEAFADWVTSGGTSTNKATQTYDRLFGWTANRERLAQGLAAAAGDAISEFDPEDPRIPVLLMDGTDGPTQIYADGRIEEQHVPEEPESPLTAAGFRIDDPELVSMDDWRAVMGVDMEDVIGDAALSARNNAALATAIAEAGVADIAGRYVERMETLGQWVADNVAATVEDAVGQGLSTADLIDQLTGGILSTDHARLVARTTLAGVANEATVDAWRQGGVIAKRWVSMDDARVRPTHATADGQTVPLDAFFDVGGNAAFAPGDGRLPPEELINCRCSVARIDADGAVREGTLHSASMEELRELGDELGVRGRSKRELIGRIREWQAGAGQPPTVALTRDQLLAMAKKAKVRGRHRMNKRDLVAALRGELTIPDRTPSGRRRSKALTIELANPWHDEQGLFARRGVGRTAGGGRLVVSRNGRRVTVTGIAAPGVSREMSVHVEFARGAFRIAEPDTHTAVLIADAVANCVARNPPVDAEHNDVEVMIHDTPSALAYRKEHDQRGLMNAKGWVNGAERYIHVDMDQTGGTREPGWNMPAAGAGTPEGLVGFEVDAVYTAVHEYGHVHDFAHPSSDAAHEQKAVAAFEKVTSAEAEFDMSGRMLTRHRPREIAGLSEYGSTNSFEAYAEAFTEWTLTGGKTTNAASKFYAEVFGWK